MRGLLLAGLVFISCQVNAQIIGSGLTGRELKSILQVDYEATVLPEELVADTLLGWIFLGPDGTLEDVYTGYTIQLDFGLRAGLDAGRKGIIVGKIWPDRYGKPDRTGVWRDLHHLIPVRKDVELTRGSVPFADIPDTATETWWRLGERLYSRPIYYKDEYSESNAGFFEPRENQKGDVARSMFYVATIYELSVEAGWIELQKQTLLDWHRTDPPDSLEQYRTRLVEEIQGNVNPFIVDTSLVHRTWFEGDQGSPVNTTAIFDFTGNETCPSVADTVYQQPSDVLLSPFERAGVACSRSFNSFGSQDWPPETIPDPTRFIGFHVTPRPEVMLDLSEKDSLHLTVGRSDSGPIYGQALFVTGDTTILLGTWDLPIPEARNLSFALPAYRSAAPFTIRLYAYAAPISDGIFWVDDVSLGYHILLDPVASEPDTPTATFDLSAAYPNPFNPVTTFRLDLGHPQQVRIEVYDLLGRRLSVLSDELRMAGSFTIRWDAASYSSGVYLVRATGDKVVIRMVTLIK